jgi:hypothetical protein
MRTDRVRQIVGLSAVGFGVLGSLSPQLLARTFGMRTDTAEFNFVMRLAGIEDLGLGINLLLANTDEVPRLLALAAAIDGGACLAAIGGGLAGRLPKRTAIVLAATMGGAALLAASPLIRTGSSPELD